MESLYYGHTLDGKSVPYKGVLISGDKMYIILMFTFLTLGVSLYQECSYFRGVLISGVSLFQGYPYIRSVLISGVSYFRGVIFQGCP